MAEAGIPNQITSEMEQTASLRAKERAQAAKWDLNIAIFLFAILILVIILATYAKTEVEIVSLIAIFGLSIAWLVGWRRERELYQRFYNEELLKLGEQKKVVKKKVKEAVEETVEEKVQKALRERWK